MKRKKGGACSQAASGVMHTPSRARTRVVCHTGVNENNPFIAIPRTREGAHARDVRSKAALAAWRVKTFGGNYDPVRAVVDEAVAAFSSRQPEVDRAIWLKVANEIGFSAFKEKVVEMERIVVDCIERGNPLRHPAAAFQARLNRYTGHGKQKGISPERSEPRKRPLGGCQA